MRYQLKFLSGDINFTSFGGKWISKKFNNGDFDYWLVVELINMKDAAGEDEPYTYCMNIMAVAPNQVSNKDMNSAIESCGYGNTHEYTPIEKVEILSSYGFAANLWEECGNNFSKLWKKAHQEIIKINMLFGFYMDRNENRIGSNGWDFIKGDILAGLKRHTEEE